MTDKSIRAELSKLFKEMLSVKYLFLSSYKVRRLTVSAKFELV